MLLYRLLVAAALGRAAWCLAMPVTHVRLGKETFTVYVHIDMFCERWIDAKRSYKFVQLTPKIWANPIQITMAWGGTR